MLLHLQWLEFYFMQEKNEKEHTKCYKDIFQITTFSMKKILENLLKLR